MKVCTACRREINASTGLQGAKTPRPGDISVCLYCGALHRYVDHRGNLRPIRGGELGEIMRSEMWPLIKKAQNAARRVMAEKGSK